MVQIRERDLPARELYSLTKAVTERLRRRGTRVLVNDRADIAASTGAGVHLTTRSLTAEVVRSAFGTDILIGVSTHNRQEAEAAERGGADFIVFGPVFETASKAEYGEPVGLDALRRVATSLRIPVIALGGVNPTNFHEALDAGAAGVAGISMFIDSAFIDSAQSQALGELVSTIKDWNSDRPKITG
jgi:thiamine-phosphate pyrophosphorylase